MSGALVSLGDMISYDMMEISDSQVAINYMTAHLTSLIQLAISVLFSINIYLSQIKFLLCQNPAILIFVNFVVSVRTLISKQPYHRHLDSL